MPQDEPKQKPSLASRLAEAGQQAEASAPPAERSMTLGGFGQNAMNDAFDLVKGLYQLIPTAARYISDPKRYFNDVSLLFKPGAFGEVASHIGEAIIEPYRTHGVKVLYHRPVSTLLDLLTVIDLGAGSAIRVGKLAGSAKLVNAAERLRAAPAALMRNAIDKGVGFTGIDLAKRREFLALKRTELAQVPIKVKADMETVGNRIRALSDAEAALWHRARTTGATLDELRAHPAVAEALEAYRVLAGEWKETLKARGLLTEGQALETLAKKYAAEQFGRINKETLAQARSAIATAEVKPIYGPAVFEQKHAFNLDEFLREPGVTRAGKVGFLERFTGAAGAIKDPRVYVPKAIEGFRRLEGRLRLNERILQSGPLVAARPGVVAEPFSAAKVPEGVFRRYFEDRVRAEAASKITDPTIQRLLRLEYTRATGWPASFLRLYDAVLGAFRSSATVVNPSWYTGNAVGDAVLGTLAGSNWAQARRLLARGRAPVEVVGEGGMAGVKTGFGGFLERAADIGNFADRATRAGIVSRSVARDLKAASVTFEASAATMEEVMASSRQFSDVQVQMQLLSERLARADSRVAAIDRLMPKFVERERRFASLLESQVAVPQRVGQLESRVRALEAAKIGLLESRGVAREASRQAAREIRGLIRRLPPEDLGRAFARELAKYKVSLSEHDIRNLVEATRRQASIAQQLRAGRGAARQAEAAAAQTMEARAAKVGGTERELEQVRQKIVNLGTAREAIARDLAADAVKQGELEARIPGLAQQNAILQRGIERANAFVGDYLGLDGFEQSVMRRLVPFYAWSKAMTMLAFRLPFAAPTKTFLWNRYSAMLWSSVGDPEMPEYTRGYVPVFARENGDTVWVKLGRFSPFASLRATEFGGVPIPSLLSPMQNPFVSLAFRMQGGRTIWEPSLIPYGEPMVNVSNGDVYEFTEDGKLRKTIPQLPLIAGVAHFFPLTQLVEDILTPYTVTKHDWLGIPRPVLNPDGTYKYPREWWQRLPLGVPTVTRKREDFIRSERVQVRQAVLSMRKAYRRADPEEREYLRQSLEDYARGEYRRIASR